jgi:hypothetical protein
VHPFHRFHYRFHFHRARVTLYFTRILFIGALCAAPAIARAQEPASASNSGHAAPAAVSANSPIAALRDALSAACSQDQNAFTHFLTERNAFAYSHLTPAARVALMKRFVLLGDPGKPSVSTDPSGRPLVRCDTPAGAAQIQIGGADASDNLAFLPVEIRDATDVVGNHVLQIKMGLVRENGSWKLLSVGLVLLDLPSLSAEWDAAEISSTEQSAVDSLKQIAQATEAFRRKYARLPEALANLGPPASGAPSGEAAGLLDADLASGTKNGYLFRYVVLGASTLGAPAKYALAATPRIYGRTGHRSFFRDANGEIHGADHQGSVGSELDPPVE